MSFSSEVKTELLEQSRELENCCDMAELYGMLLVGRVFSAHEICVMTESRAAAEYLLSRLHILTVTAARLLQVGRKWELRVARKDECLRLFGLFGHAPGDVSRMIVSENFTCDKCRAAFLRGAFLSCGGITAPQRQYHLEFYVGVKKLAAGLAALIGELGLEPKLGQRKGAWIVYFKDSYQMEDLLALCGASRAVMHLINIKIEKDVRNNVNRQLNFELANLGRTSAAAARQLQAIEVLRSREAWDALPEELCAAARLREENPDASLQELCDISEQPLTRSGLNHRLKKIVAIAEEL